MIPECSGEELKGQEGYWRQRLPGQEVKADSDGGPEGSNKQEGKQQALGEFQAGGVARSPRGIVGVVNLIEFRKPVESPPKLATIQQEK